VPLDVVLHLSVGDDPAAIHRGLDFALGAAEVVIVTGGLGPTEDDLTRQVVADHFGLELVEDGEALARIRERFAHRGLEMPESNRVQAHVPAGSQIIQNDRGTAPGFYLQQGDNHLFATPGIPYEMEGMLETFILPRLRELVGTGRRVRRAALKVYGLPESEINERLRPLMARGRNPLLGLLPHRGTITVEVVAMGEGQEEAEALLAADLALLRERLGRYIISEDGRELPQVVADLLAGRGLTVATGEVGTGGLVAALLTQPEGFERWFRLGLVFGTEQQALGQVEQHRPTVEGGTLVMAAAVRQVAGADIGVGVGPVVTPEDSTPTRPYGTVRVAVDMEGRELSRQFRFNGHRDRVRRWAADGALALIRDLLYNTPPRR